MEVYEVVENKIKKSDKMEIFELVENKIKKMEEKKLDLVTALLLGIYRNQVPEPKEPAPEPTEEEKEAKNKTDELKLKKEELASHQARLNGGFCPIQRRPVSSVKKDIHVFERKIRMREIEIERDNPLQAQFSYQLNDEWRELNRSFALEELENWKNTLTQLKSQHEELVKRIVILRKKIEELEAKDVRESIKEDDSKGESKSANTSADN